MTSPDDMKTDVAGWTVPIWQVEKRQKKMNIVYNHIHGSSSLCVSPKKCNGFVEIFAVSKLT